jgi:hypothetical protein
LEGTLVGTLEAAIVAKKKDDGSGDPLEPWRRDVIGNSARIELPLDDRFILRQIAPMMAGLAEHIAFTTRRTDLTEYQILNSVRQEINALNRFIRTKHGRALKNGTFSRRVERTEKEQAEDLRNEERLRDYLERARTKSAE